MYWGGGGGAELSPTSCTHLPHRFLPECPPLPEGYTTVYRKKLYMYGRTTYPKIHLTYTNLSSSWILESMSNVYLNPEHPPPSTATRRKLSLSSANILCNCCNKIMFCRSSLVEVYRWHLWCCH